MVSAMSEVNRIFRGVGTGLVICLVLYFCARDARASWLIDEKSYHASVHGQTACLDCHDGIADGEIHPNPEDVARNLEDFFQPEQCFQCHEGVQERLEEGFHGSLRIKKPREYGRCIECHDPHSQFPLDAELKTRMDPDRSPAEQCGLCHEERQKLPLLPESDRGCMACHRSLPTDDPQAAGVMARFCFHCHGMGVSRAQKMTALRTLPIVVEDYLSTPHKAVACTQCHLEAAQFRHDAQEVAECSRCHPPHDEKVAHDAHTLVSCGACHLGGVAPVRDLQTSRVLWKMRPQQEGGSPVHQMEKGEERESCRKCHFPGNQVGAAAMVLPAKSILCMPCHAATFSIGDGITVTVLVLFILGGLGIFMPWLTALSRGKGTGTPAHRPSWTRKAGTGPAVVGKALLLDVLLQRRLYRQSPLRWCIHSLIFLPIVFRFLWGMVALVGSLWKPGWHWVWPMLDKNFSATAFLFDLTGMMIIVGVVMAFARGVTGRGRRLSGLPKQDPWALIIIAFTVILGFLLEGMRIAMTGRPPGSPYSFIGYWISLLFSDHTGLPRAYGYMWYAHAVLTGAFIVYIPFSRMLHIILAPLVLTLRGLSDHGRGNSAGRP